MLAGIFDYVSNPFMKISGRLQLIKRNCRQQINYKPATHIILSYLTPWYYLGSCFRAYICGSKAYQDIYCKYAIDYGVGGEVYFCHEPVGFEGYFHGEGEGDVDCKHYNDKVPINPILIRMPYYKLIFKLPIHLLRISFLKLVLVSVFLLIILYFFP